MTPYTPRQRRALLVLAVLGALAAGVGVALAAPPVEGSPDWEIMHPYAEWVTTRHDPAGRFCCDIGDGRPVDARVDGDHWIAHVEPKHWGDDPMNQGLTDQWISIPDTAIIHDANPTGYPILWLWHGRVQCFAPTGGV